MFPSLIEQTELLIAQIGHKLPESAERAREVSDKLLVTLSAESYAVGIMVCAALLNALLVSAPVKPNEAKTIH
jgi:hypothetical protein